VAVPGGPLDLDAVPRELDRPKLLIGEGKDEVLILNALIDRLAIDDVTVEEYGGKQNLPNYLDALKLRPGFAALVSLGVTRDADANAKAAFTSVKNHLRNRGLATSDVLGVLQAGRPNIGIMIFPNNNSEGMLEDLCLQAWQTDPIMPCINDYFRCVRGVTGSLPNEISKARVHAWLSAQVPPDLRLGIAAQKGLIDWHNPAFENLINFVRSL